MNTFKSFRYLSVAVLLGTWGCSQKQVATKGDYDDLYGSSKDAPQVATYRTSSQPSNIYQNPDNTDNLRYQREEMPAQTGTGGTDEYYDENYVNSRKIQRGYSADPGYSSGFSDGYQSGWNDYAWSQPMGWASPFSRFGYYSPFGYNSFGGFGSSFSLGLGLGYGLGYGGGYGGFGSPFYGGGMYSPYSAFYSPFYSPYNSFYSPYSSFYSPYDYYGYGYGGYGAYGYPGGYAYNVTSGVVGAAKNRTYGPRDGGRGSAYYNDRFNNTAIRTNDGGRRADGNARSYSGASTGRSYSGNDGYYATPRRNGSDNSSFNNTPNSSRASSSGNDTYYARPRRNGGYDGGSSSGGSTRTYDYSRPSSSTRSSGSGTPSSTRGSDSWSRSSSPSSNSSWSSPSRSSSGGSSSGGGSRGGGGGGGGGSRGPR